MNIVQLTFIALFYCPLSMNSIVSNTALCLFIAHEKASISYQGQKRSRF